ncbi:peptide ABC transporter substrate-binding protein, partial [Pantoea dispersa]
MKSLVAKTAARTFLALCLSSALAQSQAAEIPAGTSLADTQRIVINNGSEVSSLDPQKVEGVPESNVIRNLLEGLVETDNNGQLVPGVAQQWQNQQGRIWTFTLRKDARWGNGEPV